MMWGGRDLSRAAGLEWIIRIKRTSENEFPKVLILIFFVFLVITPAKTKICMEQKFILQEQRTYPSHSALIHTVPTSHSIWSAV